MYDEMKPEPDTLIVQKKYRPKCCMKFTETAGKKSEKLESLNV